MEELQINKSKKSHGMQNHRCIWPKNDLKDAKILTGKDELFSTLGKLKILANGKQTRFGR